MMMTKQTIRFSTSASSPSAPIFLKVIWKALSGTSKSFWRKNSGTQWKRRKNLQRAPEKWKINELFEQLKKSGKTFMNYLFHYVFEMLFIKFCFLLRKIIKFGICRKSSFDLHVAMNCIVKLYFLFPFQSLELSRFFQWTRSSNSAK